jgi:DNA polymerase/3'-5' exonuclease PolX
MSSGTVLTLAQAEPIAEYFLGLMAPACERIEVVGSLRRRRIQVGDIELLLIPKWGKGEPTGLFEEDAPTINLALAFLDEMVERGDLVKRTNINGQTMWGAKTQYAQFGSVNIDIFQVHDPECWGVQKMIRTGPAEFSKSFVTQRNKGGKLPNDLFVKDGRVWKGGSNEPLSTPTEDHFFRLCGYASAPDPQDRNQMVPQPIVR